jgi:hypothetical protein
VGQGFQDVKTIVEREHDAEKEKKASEKPWRKKENLDGHKD